MKDFLQAQETVIYLEVAMDKSRVMAGFKQSKQLDLILAGK